MSPHFSDEIHRAFAPGEYYSVGSLPIPLTVSALAAFLADRSFEVENNRATGGGLWVKADDRF